MYYKIGIMVNIWLLPDLFYVVLFPRFYVRSPRVFFFIYLFLFQFYVVLLTEIGSDFFIFVLLLYVLLNLFLYFSFVLFASFLFQRRFYSWGREIIPFFVFCNGLVRINEINLLTSRGIIVWNQFRFVDFYFL